MVETLTIWNDGVSLMEQGNFQDALMNFIALEGRTDSSQQLITSGRNLFNIGQTYLALGRLDRAAKSFEESVDKDTMLAVAHFMLGNVNLALDRDENALQNFNDANFYLRGNKLINYQQLGLKYKLYLCEILANRAIAHSRLGNVQEARDDFLTALQAKVEPRHSIIEDALLCWQRGQIVEPLKVPSHAVFQPQKRQVAAIKDKRDFLGQSKVVAAHEVARFPDARQKPPASPVPSRKDEDDQSAEEHIQEAKEAATNRHALMKDLRKKETRKSLKRVSTPLEPPSRPLPNPPDRPNSPSRPSLPSPKGLTLPPRSGGESRSPTPRRRMTSAPISNIAPHLQNGSPTRSRSAFEMKPPAKPLPPAPKGRSPLPARKISSPAFLAKNRDVTVTVQLVLTRSIKVDAAASTQDLVRAAANTFKMTEDSIALWCMKDGQLSTLQDKDLEGILGSPETSRETIFCYENKPE